MPEKFLKLEWNSKQYAVPLEDVCGVMGAAWPASADSLNLNANKWECPPAFIACDKGADWGNKQTVILQSNNIQIALIVDSVMTVFKPEEDDVEVGESANFRIWCLKPNFEKMDKSSR